MGAGCADLGVGTPLKGGAALTGVLGEGLGISGAGDAGAVVCGLDMSGALA